jgi:phosphatidylglycerol---prolipoprotein diacylglyceryl transferase
MHPILMWLQFGDHKVPVGAYSTFMTLGWIAMVAVATGVAHMRGQPWRRVLAVFAGALLGGVVGARVLDVATNSGLHAESAHLLWRASFQGFALYGGLVSGALVAVALARLLRLPVWKLADCSVPALAIGIALMRTGCFLRGCCFGVASDLPWAVTFPTGSPAWAQQLLSGQTGILGMAGGMHPVHPTQLYELGAALLLAVAALLWQRWRGLPDGAGFLTFAIGFTLFRAANGILRVPLPDEGTPAWFYPVLYAAVVLVAGVTLGARLAQQRSSAGPTVAVRAAAGPPPLPWEAVAEEQLAAAPIPAADR